MSTKLCGTLLSAPSAVADIIIRPRPPGSSDQDNASERREAKKTSQIK